MSKSQKVISVITCDHCNKQEQTPISSNWFELYALGSSVSILQLDNCGEYTSATTIGTYLQFCSKECFINFMSNKYDELIKGE